MDSSGRFVSDVSGKGWKPVIRPRGTFFSTSFELDRDCKLCRDLNSLGLSRNPVILDCPNAVEEMLIKAIRTVVQRLTEFIRQVPGSRWHESKRLVAPNYLYQIFIHYVHLLHNRHKGLPSLGKPISLFQYAKDFRVSRRLVTRMGDSER